MRLYFFLAVALTFGVAPAFAESKSKATDIELNELMQVLEMEKTQNSTIQHLVDQQASNSAVIKRHKATYLKFMQETVGWDAVKGRILDLWKQTFTKDELKDLIAFYKTPTGRKAIRSMPDLIAKTSALGQKAVQEHLPELQKRIEDDDKKSSDKDSGKDSKKK